jgi:hypothetical protein
MLVISLVALLFMFIPSCTGIMYVVDQFRYGRFEYPTISAMPTDGHVELPSKSRNIILYKNDAGHTAKFEIATSSLIEWINEMRALRPDLNPVHQIEAEPEASPAGLPEEFFAQLENESSARQKELLNRGFPEANWGYDPKMLTYHVSRSPQGGGYTVWHVPESGVAYLTSGYW